MRGPSDDEVEVTQSFIVKAFVSFNLHAWGAQMQLKGSGADDHQSKPRWRGLRLDSGLRRQARDGEYIRIRLKKIVRLLDGTHR
jgi:hypothetical protein